LNLIYPAELVVKDTTNYPNSASYHDLYLEHDINGTLTTKLYDKRDEFNFPIVNYPFLDSNIPSSPAYGVYISQFIRYSRACNSYQVFLRCVLLTRELLNQGFIQKLDWDIHLKSDLDLTLPYRVSMTTGAGNAYPSGAPGFTSGFYRCSCCPVICVTLFCLV